MPNEVTVQPSEGLFHWSVTLAKPSEGCFTKGTERLPNEKGMVMCGRCVVEKGERKDHETKNNVATERTEFG